MKQNPHWDDNNCSSCQKNLHLLWKQTNHCGVHSSPLLDLVLVLRLHIILLSSTKFPFPRHSACLWSDIRLQSCSHRGNLSDSFPTHGQDMYEFFLMKVKRWGTQMERFLRGKSVCISLLFPVHRSSHGCNGIENLHYFNTSQVLRQGWTSNSETTYSRAHFRRILELIIKGTTVNLKAYGGREGVSRWWVVSFALQSLYPR
jgi:hypothetical protein